MKLIIISYGIFLLALSLFTYLFIDPNLIYLESLFTNFAYLNREIVSLTYLIFISLFFVFYLVFLRKITRKMLISAIIISVAFLLFSYPAILSYDIFNYIFTAKVLFGYHENPFIIMPIEFTSDPLLLFTHAANKVVLYGPSWVVISGVPYLLGFNNFLLTLFNFKLTALIFYLGTTYLIFRITKNVENVAFFALSPLVLIEILISSHNDAVMMFFALLAILLLKKDKFFLAIVFLLLSILIKYATIFLIPVFLYFIILKIKKKKIDWDKIYIFASLLMLVVFLLSPVREEIYPWYGIWFLTFISLTGNKSLRILGVVLSFGLLLRYVPYMYSGTHSGMTPLVKTLVTYIPLGGVILYSLKDIRFFRKSFSK